MKNWIFLVVSLSCSLFAETFHLGGELKRTFPFAADPAKRGADAPFISGNTYRSIANWCLDETDLPIDTDKVVRGDIIFVKGCILDNFIHHVHPHIKEPYILLSCDADHTNGLDYQMVFVNSENLIVMGSVNCQETGHPKIIPLPLGIPNGSAVGFPKKNQYTDIIAKNLEKTIFCSSNFTIGSHKRREYVYDVITKKQFIKNLLRSSPENYILNIAKSKFCISPRGAGLDCFRIWEALLLNCVPVVETSFLDPLFYQLPVLIIDDYSNLTKELLIEFNRNVIKHKNEFHKEKIYAKYWLDFFLQLQFLVRNGIDHAGFVREFKKQSFNIL
ncbi:MAG: glycosyltransferase family 47 protein [Simkaniaceae bacterium]|nr:glycosyltransferase family 47 protein [Simkaniaceae bacterium]